MGEIVFEGCALIHIGSLCFGVSTPILTFPLQGARYILWSTLAFPPPCRGRARVGVEPLNFPLSLLTLHPDYSRHRCSRSAGLASLATAKKLSYVRHKQAAPGVVHHQVQSPASARYRRSRRCIVRSDAGDGSGVRQAVSRAMPATAYARHRSCHAEVILLLKWLTSGFFGWSLKFLPPS